MDSIEDRRWDPPPPVPTPEEMEAHHHHGLWVWDLFIGYDHWPPYTFLTLVGPTQEAAPIAEGGGEIIEQAKEEAFLAWGL